jgi:hypothetical protein
MSLRLSDCRELAVAQSGPGFVILANPASFAIPSGEEVVLSISVDGASTTARMRVIGAVNIGENEVMVG